MPTDERRRTPRTKITEIVYVDLGNQNGGFVLNVSEGGLGFCAAAPVTEGDIKFSLAVTGMGRVDGTGRIVWSDAGRRTCGVAFTGDSAGIGKRLIRWVEEREQRAARARPAQVDTPMQPMDIGPSAPIGSAPPSPTRQPSATAPSAPAPLPPRAQPAPPSASSSPPAPMRPMDVVPAEPVKVAPLAPAPPPQVQTLPPSPAPPPPQAQPEPPPLFVQEKIAAAPPTQPPVEAPSEASVQSPVEPPMQASAQPADSPVFVAPVEPPVEAPTPPSAPVQPPAHVSEPKPAAWPPPAPPLPPSHPVPDAKAFAAPAPAPPRAEEPYATPPLPIGLGASPSPATRPGPRDFAPPAWTPPAERGPFDPLTVDDLRLQSEGEEGNRSFRRGLLVGLFLTLVAAGVYVYRRTPSNDKAATNAATSLAGSSAANSPGARGGAPPPERAPDPPMEGGQSELDAALQYLHPPEGNRDTAAAIQMLKAAMEKGSTTAQVILAEMYLYGDGVAKDCSQARSLLTAAAKTQNREARAKLAELDVKGCQ